MLAVRRAPHAVPEVVPAYDERHSRRCVLTSLGCSVMTLWPAWQMGNEVDRTTAAGIKRGELHDEPASVRDADEGGARQFEHASPL